MLRFAILVHDYPVMHWDFLLEIGETCRTWRLAEEPARGRGGAAERIADHRLMYLEYEGPVSGNRGSVTRWDAGGFEIVCETQEEMVVRLAGERLMGECRLVRVEGELWRVEFAGSEF